MTEKETNGVIGHDSPMDPFETAVLTTLSELKKEVAEIKRNQDETASYFFEKKVDPLTSSNIDFDEKYRLQLPFSTVEDFNQFNEDLKENLYLRNDVYTRLSQCMDKNLIITRSFVNMLKTFLSKDLALQYTAIRKSSVATKLKFKGTEFCKIMDEKCRVYASISFAVLLLGVGLPLWWETTAVPRVSLPYQGIRALDELDLRIHLRLLLGCLDEERCEDFAVELLRRLTDAGQSEIYRMSISHFSTANTSIARAKSIADLDRASMGFDFNYGDILVLEAPAGLGEDQVYVSSERSVYIAEEADGSVIARVLRQWIYRDVALTLTRNALTAPTEFSLDVENRRRFPVSPNYDVLLTVVNPEPEQLSVDRGLARIAQDYFEPFLEELSMLASFSVKSQWLYLLPLGVKPKQVPDASKSGRHYALPEDVLPQIITPLEKKLASQVSLHPTINLVAYVVPCDGAPLYIYTQSGRRLHKELDFEAFHSPRWGGIALVNPPEEFCANQTKENQVFKPNEEILVGVFLQQLRLLLGIPDKEEITGVRIAPLDGIKPRGWELDDLMRVRSVEQLTSAKLTLQSLARLLREISNIVITETVGNRITRALELIQLAAKHLDEGDLLSGFLASKEAFVISEAAFTDPSLLALLYFPDDQKYAVYIPLFLPVMIPVLFSLKNIKNYLFCSD